MHINLYYNLINIKDIFFDVKYSAKISKSGGSILSVLNGRKCNMHLRENTIALRVYIIRFRLGRPISPKLRWELLRVM